MNIAYIDEMDIKNKSILLRADLNVPLDNGGNITDDTRIRAVLPTINYALDENAKVILVSHLGRPKGKRVEGLSLAPVAKRLSRLLDKDVKFIPETVGGEVESAISSMKQGEVVLLENLRFYPEEESNDAEFGQRLAKLAEVYINDAFATAHRSHASNVAVTRFIGVCGAGLLMRQEITYFERAVENPVRPVVAIVGGAKISDKLRLLGNLSAKVDKLIVGGGLVFTLFKAIGYEVGKSIVEDSVIDDARAVVETIRGRGIKFYLPVDFVVADKFDPSAETKVVTSQEIPKDWMALDIGPATTALFSEAIQNAKTIIWNGPMGVFELDAFSRGTYAMISHVANTYALTIIGGGDTDVAVHRAGEMAKMSYISTGGGAFLALLEGKDLPGIAALRQCSAGAQAAGG